MTLKELKKIIAEEYTAYKKTINEQPDMPDLPGVAVSDNDVDATGGGGNAEATLKDIYEMLKDFFEGGDAGADAADDAADDEADDAADDEAGDVEEGHGGKMYDEDDKDVKKESAGKNSGYKTVNESKKVRHKKSLQNIENRLLSERFKKLANIIK